MGGDVGLRILHYQLLTGLREGVEAALIVSIMAYLAKTGNQRYFGPIWLGAGVAVALSVVIGLILFNTIGGLEEPADRSSRASPCSSPPRS